MMRIAKGMPAFCNGFKTNSCVGCAAFGCGVHSHIGENAAIKIIGCRLKRPSPPGLETDSDKQEGQTEGE